eukprot:COSAG02_NODE_2493_length_8695_cov_46.139581_5_plen_73_part_00
MGAEEEDVDVDVGELEEEEEEEEEEASVAFPTRRHGARHSAGADTNCGVSPLARATHASATAAPQELLREGL